MAAKVSQHPFVRFRRGLLMSMTLAACVCQQVASGRSTTCNSPMVAETAQLQSQIELRSLRPGYRLYRAPTGTAGTPIVYWLKPAVLDDEGRVVSMPRRLVDISPFISRIGSPHEALAFVRVSTRFPDFLMFEDGLLEIQRGDEFLRIPESLKTQLLPPMVRARQNGGFEIARDLIKLDKAHKILSVFRSDEKVGLHGEYEMNVLRIYPVPPGDIGIHLPE